MFGVAPGYWELSICPTILFIFAVPLTAFVSVAVASQVTAGVLLGIFP
jgi:hypothetical protein